MSYYSSVIMSNSPQGYWRMDDPFGTVAKDQTVNAYHGTIQGGVTLGQTGALSLDADTAMLFDGGTGLILLPSGPNVNGWGAISIEALINLSNITFGYTANIVANDAPNTSHVGVQLGVTTTTVVFRIGTGSAANTLTVNKTFAANTWYRICATFTGTVMTVYIRDLLGNLTTDTLSVTATTIAASTNQLMIGAKPGATPNNLPGLVDETVVYNYALTSSQDASNYAAATIATYPYTYGAFQINNHSGGLGYFLAAKDLDLPTYKPTLSPLARYDGWKINGWQVSERQIQTDLITIGSSRADCEVRLDALFQALALRDQQLTLHSADGRYWVANALTGKVKFAGGSGVVQAKVPVTFVCASPYANAASAATPYDTGSVLYTASGSNYVSPTFTFAGGGTQYAWPQIHIVNKTPNQGFTTLASALTLGSTYTSLSVVSSPALTAGQILTLYYAPLGGGATLNTQKVTVSQNVSATSTTIPVNSFTAAWPFTSGTFVYVSTAWNQLALSQVTDNYTLSVTSTTAAPLPQTSGDYLDIYTSPDTGMYLSTNGSSQYIDFIGAFPPVEFNNTQWSLSLTADYVPTVQVLWIWTPRFSN